MNDTFDVQARFILYQSDPALAADTQVVNQAARVLERPFRDQIQNRGFPLYEKIKCAITGKAAILPTLGRLTENCRLPGGSANSAGVASGGNSLARVIAKTVPLFWEHFAISLLET